MTIELSRGTAVTAHAPAAIFDLWSSPQTWATWDPEVRSAQLDGDIEVGARGRLKPRSGPAATFTIVEVIEGEALVDASALPGARLVFDHRVTAAPLIEAGSGSSLTYLVTVVITVEGPMSPLFGRLLRRSFEGAAQSGIDGLLAHLDADHAPQPSAESPSR